LVDFDACNKPASGSVCHFLIKTVSRDIYAFRTSLLSCSLLGWLLTASFSIRLRLRPSCLVVEPCADVIVSVEKKFLQDSRKMFVLPQKNFMIFLVKHTNVPTWQRRRADKLSAALRRSPKVDSGGTHKLAVGARPAQGSTWWSQAACKD